MAIPITYVTYTPSVPTTDFTYTFPTVSTAHTKASLDGVVQTSGVDYDLIDASTTTGGTVRFVSAVAAGTIVTVYRETPIVAEGLPVDFVDGSILTEADLDKNFNSLLYAAQEDEEDTGINLDASYAHWDADNKKITGGIAGTNDGDFVTLQQLEQVELYGPQSSPQGWAFLSNTTNDTEFILNTASGTSGSDLPASTNVSLYLVEVGGVLQRATTDFTITAVGDVYTLTLTTGLDDGTVPVIVRNFGVSRQIIEQPLIPDGTEGVGLKLQANSGQTGDMLQVNASDGTTQMAAITKDGHILVGTDTDATNLTLKDVSIELGDVEPEDTDKQGVLLVNSYVDGRPMLTLQGTSVANLSSSALQVFRGNTEKLKIQWNGDVTCTSVIASGDITATGDVTCDDLSGTGLKIGGGYGNTGCTISNAGKIETDSTIKAVNLTVRDGTGNGIKGVQEDGTTRPGMLWFTSGGPALDYGDDGAWIKAASTKIDIGGNSDNSAVNINNVKAPTLDLHAANKAYVDEGRWLYAGTAILDSTTWAAVGSGYSSYDRIRLVFSNMRPKNGDTNCFFFWDLVQSDGSTRIDFVNTTGNDYHNDDIRTQNGYGQLLESTADDYYTANPINGVFTINNMSTAYMPADLEYYIQCDNLDLNTSGTGRLITQDSNPTPYQLRFIFGEGTGVSQENGITGTVKIYTFKYPTS